MTRFFRLVETSLRARMLLGTGIMLLPLVALGIGSFWASKSMVDAIENVIKTETLELQPVTELQKLILRAAMPPNDYLIAANRSERLLFEHLVRETDQKFQDLLESRFFEEEDERTLIRAAHAEWDKARAAGSAIMALADPKASPEAGTQMKVFDAYIARAADTLSLLYDKVLGELNEHQASAVAVKRRETIFHIATFVVALAIAGFAGLVLSRSILLPIRALQDGMFRFSQGDHSFRVVLDRRDEFGRLATTMNMLAERLEYDSLTGVYNRSEFHRKLKLESERSLRYGHVFSLLMLDLDHFKAVNDTAGHQGGDDALRAVTMRLIKDLRSADVIARYGGEEFTVIMPETGGKTAAAVAERLRASVAGFPVTTTQGRVLNITVSIGVATFPGDARSEDELVAAADQALYGAKRAGRNRVVSFAPGMESAGGRTSA